MSQSLAALAGSDCERLHAGWLAQPANTLSCVAFLAVGCWLLIRARDRDQRGLPVAGAGAMIAVGVGSFAYHGPQPGWAAPAHDWSVLALVLVLILWTARLLRAPAALRSAWKAARPWLLLGGVAYAAGRTGSPWCRPGSLWQPHAVWHVLIAVASGRALAVRDFRA